MQEIKIKSKDNGALTELYIDGKKIEGVRSYELSHGAGGTPILKLDINALNISVDSPVLLFDKNSMQEMTIGFREE